MALTNTRLTTTDPTTVFDAVGAQAITVIYLCNTTASVVLVNVFVINSSDSTGSAYSNMVYSQLELTANETYVISTEKLILSDNDLIEVEANIADCVTVTVSSINV
jgi:hypothetical protein|tara:strand:+ start:781 stop:1098 length:318 start_codon:yes stop_codon:yes gene_type:complete